MKIFLIASLLFTSIVLAEQAPVVQTEEFYGAIEPKSQPRDSAELVSSQSFSTDVWFHSIELELSGDVNDNGFYHQLYLEFDADTNRSSKAVFAEFSLQRGNRPEQLFHTSSIFTLYGQSRDDWFAIDTTLEANYPTDYYTLIIRIYDATSGWLLAELSGYDEPILDLLPLEDIQRDRQRVEVITTSGGSFGIFALLGLSLLLWRRRMHVSSSTQAG
ncbi:choice-of-anchor H family protein [Alkalimonas collagenimarina]|uniref:Choice-of-anchor H family protein n=1 Tax=Alkalimonas collagenimarina TaxID=400390 RepID=A0ABT9GYH5_9GAMM|nr:choice-of-anchor H family protein [Alkalimonas collagenimarina]MDP4536102.1 choice-of-anchor H family protein [Alkalimonas collagenimarina]